MQAFFVYFSTSDDNQQANAYLCIVVMCVLYYPQGRQYAPALYRNIHRQF
jgi:hypothetical protein